MFACISPASRRQAPNGSRTVLPTFALEPGRRGYLPKKNCSRALVLPVPRYFTNRHAPFFSRFACASNSASRSRYCADVLPSKSGVRTP